MTTYTLPDGTEIASLDVSGGPSPSKKWVTHPLLGSILIDADKLTEVKPPLPPEPPDGYVGRAGTQIWERDDEPEHQGDLSPGRHWWRVGDDQPYTWDAAHEIMRLAGFILVELVPDPAADAPALPWRVDGDIVEVKSQDFDDNMPVWVHITGWYSLDQVEERAAAMLRAVREARRS